MQQLKEKLAVAEHIAKAEAQLKVRGFTFTIHYTFSFIISHKKFKLPFKTVASHSWERYELCCL